MDELISTLLEAIKQLQEKDTLIEEELKGFEDEYSKDKKLIDKQLVDLFGQIDRLIKEEVAKIPTPKDGKDFDRDMAVGLIRKEFTKLIEQKDKDIQTVKIELAKILSNTFNQWIKDNRESLQGQDGADGINGKDGADGKDGETPTIDYQEINNTIKELFATLPKPQDGQDGVSIEDIKEDKGDIVITLTNGEVKRIKLPTKTITKNVGGGGGLNLNAVSEVQQILDTDFIPIIRNNKLYKVSAPNAKIYYNYTYVVDNGIDVTYNGNKVIYKD